MAGGGSAARTKDVSGQSSSESAGSKSANGEPRERGDVRKQLRKTKLCVYHFRGACQFGVDCAFAHSAADLEATPDLRKTRICKLFQERKCKDDNCTFAHGGKELRNTDAYFKKTLCIWNERGKCRNGDSCQFAHGMKDLCNSQALAPSAQSRRKIKAQKNSVSTDTNQTVPKADKATGATLSEPMFVPIPGSAPASTSPSGSVSIASARSTSPSRQTSSTAPGLRLPPPAAPLMAVPPTTAPPEVVASAMASAMEAAKLRLQVLLSSGAHGAALETAVADLQQHTTQLMAQCSSLLQQQQQHPGLGHGGVLPPDLQLAQFLQLQSSQLSSIHSPKVAEPLWTYSQAGLGIWGA